MPVDMPIVYVCPDQWQAWHTELHTGKVTRVQAQDNTSFTVALATDKVTIMNNRISHILKRLRAKQATIEDKHLQALVHLDIMEHAYMQADSDVDEVLAQYPEYADEAWAARATTEALVEQARVKVRLLEAAFDSNQQRQAWVQKIRGAKVPGTRVDFVAETRNRIVGKIKLPSQNNRLRRSKESKEYLAKQEAERTLVVRQRQKQKQREITKAGQR